MPWLPVLALPDAGQFGQQFVDVGGGGGEGELDADRPGVEVHRRQLVAPARLKDRDLQVIAIRFGKTSCLWEKLHINMDDPPMNYL